MYRHFSAVALCLGAAFLAGCGPAAPKTYRVAGTITWNGHRLPDGDIIFEPVDPNVIPDRAVIEDGQYEARVRPGKKRVRIHASRENSKWKDLGMQGALEQYLPARYNSETTLTAAIAENDENHFDFALTEKK
jgi:hypothetical protein